MVLYLRNRVEWLMGRMFAAARTDLSTGLLNARGLQYRLPAPPARAFSSTVTSFAWLAAAARIASRSSGLTKRMLTQLRPSSPATASAVGTMAPKASKAARFENGRPAPAGARNLSARPYTK